MTSTRHPPELDPQEPITIRGNEYVVEGRQGSELALFKLTTGETLTMTYAAVMREANLSDIPMAEGLSTREARKTRSKLKGTMRGLLIPHLEEVVYGKPLKAAKWGRRK